MELNFRVKVFILFGIFTVFFRIFFAFYPNAFSMVRLISVLFSTTGIILFVFYGLAIFFLLKEKPWAWLIAMIPSLWMLFDPIKLEGFPIASGLFFYFIHTIVNQTPQQMISVLFNMAFPVIVIIYCLLNFGTKLIHYQKKKFDILVGTIFLIITAIGFIGIPELWIYGGLSLKFLLTYPPTYISFSYIGLTIFWHIKNSQASTPS